MRKILIVPNGEVDKYLQHATNNGISEIVEGIPIGCLDKYTESQLPIIHVEDDTITEPTEVEILRVKVQDQEVAILELAELISGVISNG